MTDHPAPDVSWEHAELLAEPTRRAVFEAVRAARRATTRDEVAEKVGIQRRLAAFHLDRLADAGLLSVTYARPDGRTGPGAGRPAKRYDARHAQVTLSVPPRRHDLVGRLLARAVAENPLDAADRAGQLAEDEGRRMGELRRPTGRPSSATTLAAASDALAAIGYEPERERSALRLRNCPFHDVMESAPELICALNHRLITGLLAGLEAPRHVHAELQPTPGQCCVTISSQRARRTAMP